MAKEVAIIGGGGTGLALAAYLGMAGLDARLHEDPGHKSLIAEVAEAGEVEVSGAINGIGRVAKVTTDMEEALAGAELILVAVHAARHEDIARSCCPLLEDGQMVVLAPGNVGSLVFAKVLNARGIKRNVVIGDLQANFFSCRRRGPRSVFTASAPTRQNFGAAFPARDTLTLIKGLEGIFPCAPAANVLEVCLNNPNLVGHLGPSILNAVGIEQQGERFSLHQPENITEAVRRMVAAVNRERVALLHHFGWIDLLGELKKAANSPLYQQLEGPSALTHRYISEDAVTCSLMVSLAEMVGLNAPISKALVTVASAINQTNYFETGRTLEALGISGMTVGELKDYLEKG